MSSIQQSLPLATNKVMGNIDVSRNEILAKIDKMKTYTDNALDYKVEVITLKSGDGYIQHYRVFIQWVNGVKIYGKLSSYRDKEQAWFDVSEEDIPDVVLSYGRLFDYSTCSPYYVSPKDSVLNYYLTLVNDATNTVFRVFICRRNLNESLANNYTINQYTYNHATNKLTDDGAVTGSNFSYLTNAYIECYEPTGDNMVFTNNIYYVQSIPLNETNEQVCFKVIRK